MQEVSEIFRGLLPILGVFVLIALIVLLIKIIKLLGSVEETILKTHGSIDKVEETLEKIQVPVDTTVKACKGIDKAYDSSIKAIDEAKDYVAKNADTIKNKVVDVVKKVQGSKTEKKVDEPSELSLDDILSKGE